MLTNAHHYSVPSLSPLPLRPQPTPREPRQEQQRRRLSSSRGQPALTFPSALSTFRLPPPSAAQLSLKLLYRTVGVVWELLGAGAHCSPASDKHWTPLLAAAVGGHSEVTRQLIGAGASVSEKTSNGWNALHMASQAGHTGRLRRVRLCVGASFLWRLGGWCVARWFGVWRARCYFLGVIVFSGRGFREGGGCGGWCLSARMVVVEVAPRCLGTRINVGCFAVS